MTSRAKLACVTLLSALTCSSCISFSYRRELVDRPPRPAAVELLMPGQNLAECLALLGPPTRVTALDDEGRTGYRCAWIWQSRRGYDVGASGGEQTSAPVSLNFASAHRLLPALQLEFDADDVLRRFDRAYITPEVEDFLADLDY